MRSYNIDPLKECASRESDNRNYSKSNPEGPGPAKMIDRDEERSLVTPYSDHETSLMIRSLTKPNKQR